MSKQANKTIIGAFVIGALVLLVIGIVAFGSGKLFSKRITYVMFFDGSVKGLQIGSPALFRGVKIGEVTNMALQINATELKATIPVYVEVDPKKLNISGVDASKIGKGQYVKALIDKGLKAQLQSQSFVTGQLMINFDFYPEWPAKLKGLDPRYIEIPTIPSSLEQLTQSLQSLPIKEIVEKVNGVLGDIRTLVGSKETLELRTSLNLTVKDLDRLVNNSNQMVTNFNNRLGPVADGINGASVAARGAFVQAEKTLAFKEGVPGEVASGLKETIVKIDSTLDHMHSTLVSIEKITDKNVNIGYDLTKTLGELDTAARAIRSLADYLERHPESLLKGKPPSKGE
jgi:paraquat-inducible protein B